MSTENQIEANRLNAQHCTGPKTEGGKLRSSQNALKTGLYSKKEVIATESREEYEALAADYHNHYAPSNPHERSLVDALVRYEWLSRRYMAADTALWNFSLDGGKTEPGRAFMYHAENLSRAGRYFNNARKGYANTQKELEAAQAKRKSESPESPVSRIPRAEPRCKGARSRISGRNNRNKINRLPRNWFRSANQPRALAKPRQKSPKPTSSRNRIMKKSRP